VSKCFLNQLRGAQTRATPANHGPDPAGEGSGVAPEGGHWAPVRAVLAAVASRGGEEEEEEAAAGPRPFAGRVCDAARQEDPEKRGVRAAEGARGTRRCTVESAN